MRYFIWNRVPNPAATRELIRLSPGLPVYPISYAAGLKLSSSALDYSDWTRQVLSVTCRIGNRRGDQIASPGDYVVEMSPNNWHVLDSIAFSAIESCTGNEIILQYPDEE